jgi:AcrR family transcriptional regulator
MAEERDDELLDAALAAFAERGFDGTSVREIARDLGVSHNLIPQRFGSKERLWYAAIDHGARVISRELLAQPIDVGGDDIAALRSAFVRLVEVNATHPALIRIVNHEAARPGKRLDYLFDEYIQKVRKFGEALLTPLRAAGKIRTDSTSIIYFLMTHGAAGPFAVPALASRFGEIDLDDPAAIHDRAVVVVDLLFDGLLAV